MSFSFTAATRDGLSNLAASLGAGKDKAAGDRFTLFDLDRGQVEAMYRGDWLARKVVDIVPYDSVREWRAWSGHRADVARAEAAERRLGLRKAVQRAMTLGRLYGGGALLIGTGERDPAALARPLDPDTVGRGGLKFLHVVSRWQLGASRLDGDPLSPWCGEPAMYDLAGAGRGALQLHPSRVVRFLGHPLPDPSLTGTLWSDSVLQALYDAVHAVALTTAGATSLMHEAKVDVVTVPNLSEHLSSAETTAQLSARFAYAAAMKSINNLLLLGDGESWARQRVDFAGLPEMVRTFLQVAAGAADIPVTRLLGQSPAGLSATGESDVRNYYDMIAARQELDLRPQLERLDRLMLRSEGLDPDALGFAFRPLWQLDAPARAALALTKAQATQVYAGLGLWPAEVVARLAEAQLVADGTYPNAAALFAEAATAPVGDLNTGDAFPAGLGALHYLTEPRDLDGRWTTGGGGGHAGEAVEVSTESHDPSDPPGPSSGEGVAGQEGEGLRAPDGTPITLAAFKGRGRGKAGALGALLGAAARLWRRWRPEESDKPELDPLPGVHGPAGSISELPSGRMQTDKNKKAKALDPRIRSDLDDRFIENDGTLNWPVNDGADGPETPVTLESGQVLDKYGNVGGSYLSPPGTPYSARSLPYDVNRVPLRTFRVLKSFQVESSRVAPWFDEPGGGIQLRTSTDIYELVEDGYLEQKDF